MKKNYYRSGNDVMELIVTDCTGRKLFKWKANANDAKEIEKIIQDFIDKYDLRVFIKYYGNVSKEKEDLVTSLRNFDWD